MKSQFSVADQDNSRSVVPMMINGKAVITAAQAAARLGRSRSAVYRMGTGTGPFQFVRSGRRIFIDVTEFNCFLVNRIGGNRRKQQSTDASGQDPQVEAPARSQEVVPAQDMSPDGVQCLPNVEANTGGGQRELTLPQRWPHPVVYMTLQPC